MRTAEQRVACEPARSWASAHRDGEVAADPAHAAHVASCAACTAWVAAADDIDRRLALRPAPADTGVDLVAAALARWTRSPAPERSAQARTGRALLGVAAVTGLLVAGVQLLAPDTSAARLAGHVAVDLLVFEVVTAVAFLAAARRPGRYVLPMLLPVTALVVLTTLLAAGAETGTGGGLGHLLAEASHLPLLVGLAGLLLIADARELLPGPRRPLS